MRPATYKTRQDAELRAFLASLRGRHASARDVVAGLAARGVAMGQTTVYRRLEKLVAEGVVRKFVAGPGVPACFAWVGAGKEEGGTFHGYCEGCGATIHLHCHELEALGAHLAADHRFRLDPARTVFYGTCAKCARAKKRESAK